MTLFIYRLSGVNYHILTKIKSIAVSNFITPSLNIDFKQLLIKKSAAHLLRSMFDACLRLSLV